MQNNLATQKQVKKSYAEKEPSLKGTFFSVLMLGAFICLSWFGAYYLFLIR